MIDEQQLEVDAGETEWVRFGVDKQDLGLAPGGAFLEVLTRDFGQSIIVTVEGNSSGDITTPEE